MDEDEAEDRAMEESEGIDDLGEPFVPQEERVNTKKIPAKPARFFLIDSLFMKRNSFFLLFGALTKTSLILRPFLTTLKEKSRSW